MTVRPTRPAQDLLLEPGQAMHLCLPPGAGLRVSGGRLRLVAQRWLAGRSLTMAVVLEEGAVHDEAGWIVVECLSGGQARFCVATGLSPLTSCIATLKSWWYKAPIRPFFSRSFP